MTSHDELHGDDLKLVTSTRLDTDGTGENILKITKDSPVLVWDTQSLRHTFAPVVVCKEPVCTVGLGDAISSSSFSAHL